MKVINEYSTHHYEEEWSKSDYYCPYCSMKEVWTEDNDDDFYVGSKSICVACDSVLHLDHCSNAIFQEPNALGIARQIRSGKTTIPTTKKGN